MLGCLVDKTYWYTFHEFELQRVVNVSSHIIRFVAIEDCRVHLGQLVHISRDVGLDSLGNSEIKAYLINGTTFHPEATSVVYTVKQLLSPVATEACNYIRCLGLNYLDHAKVSFKL